MYNISYKWYERGINLNKKSKINNYVVDTLNGMALGLFSSLIIGLIIKQIGTLVQIESVIYMGKVSQYLMGPAIGAGVAYARKAPPLGIFASMICGAIGAKTIIFNNGIPLISIGEPAGALISSLIGAEVSKFINNKTKLNIILVPAFTIITGGIAGLFISPIISVLMAEIGIAINSITKLHPIPMGILISLIMGILLTLPVSSAAISISLGLSGLAAGAATVGCAAHMIGFAIASFKENKFSGLISQGLGTSMLQIGNIIKNPWIAAGPIISSIILGPFSTAIFHLENNKVGAGMGTSGLVGQLSSFEQMGFSFYTLSSIFIMHFFLPALISIIVTNILRKKEIIKFGDMKI